jgi:tRNA-splicing ligase RtcB
MTGDWDRILQKVDDWRWEIPADYKHGMRVPGRIYASEDLIGAIKGDLSLEQVANVATLPGIVSYSYAMPDIHWGYGFPIGGVAAMREEDGVISPGGVGYDINCGVRLYRTPHTFAGIEERIGRLADELGRTIPSGVGEEGPVRLKPGELDEVLTRGAAAALQMGIGRAEDLELCEEGGAMRTADAAQVSARAKERGRNQMGTLGSGNHFLEVQRVQQIFNPAIAEVYGIKQDRIVVMIHCGSRGLGHQVCDDFLKVMRRATEKYGISLPDGQLACTPVRSEEGRNYLAGMSAAANFAWANRHTLGHFVRQAFTAVLGTPAEEIRLVYDVAHNIAKNEEHTISGKRERVWVHRKGATRAFGPGLPQVPDRYRTAGQPVLIPGNMGTASYVLAGTERAMTESFGSSCHGAGRAMSRTKAMKTLNYKNVLDRLRKQGVELRAKTKRGVTEEAPEVYKNVDEVVRVVDEAGLARRVARLVPLAVVKG